MYKQLFSTLLLFLVYVFNYLGVNWYLGTSQMQLAEIFPFPYMPPGVIFMVAWTTIYILLLVYIIYGRTGRGRSSSTYSAIQPRFQISCLLNIFWMIATGRERYIVSVALIWWLRATLGRILHILHTTPEIDTQKQDHSVQASHRSAYFRPLVLPFGIYYGRVSLASSVVGISQLVYQRNESLTLGRTRSLIVLGIWLVVSIISRHKRRNLWQLIISLRAIGGILYALFL